MKSSKRPCVATRTGRGVINIWMALTIPAVIALVGLTLDTSYVLIVGHQLQNASDAAALAGAAKVTTDPARAQADAVSTAAANTAAAAKVQLASGDVIVGRYDQAASVFTAGGTPYNAVKVTARRTGGSPGGPVNLIFGPIFGVNTSNVSRTAVAMTGGTFAAGLVVLDPTRKSSMGDNGTPDLTITNGGIQVNSTNSSAVNVIGNATIAASELRITGGYSAGGNTSLPSTIYTGTTPVADPLAGLPAPTYSKSQDLGSVSLTGNKSASIGPGYYSGGLSVTSSNSTLTLRPGVYVLGPPGLYINGGNLNAPGVMFYLTTGTGKNSNTYGTVYMAGNGTINISPPTTGTYAGVSFFQDRATPYSTSASITGTSTLNLQGTIYLPTINLDMKGTSNNFSNQLIVDTINISGTGTLTVNYDGRNPVTINNVFLVQ